MGPQHGANLMGNALIITTSDQVLNHCLPRGTFQIKDLSSLEIVHSLTEIFR